MPKTAIDVESQIKFVRVLGDDGKVAKDSEPKIAKKTLRSVYETMVLIREFDERRLRLQRQGRIGTFAPVKGQEAAQLGVALALKDSDWVVPAFRETAIAIWRGAQMEHDLLYAAGYEEGIQLPDEPRDLPIAIPVASQIAHAVGIAWARKLLKKDDVVVTFFGEGATSHGDFHEPMNFAQVFEVPCVMVCQNNQYAISVPRSRQTKSETIAQKALAYAMRGVQVDGNDLLAVYKVAKEAIDRARKGAGPTLIEAVTYRLSVHTTADDPTKYRSDKEVEEAYTRDPIPRLREYLLAKGVLKKDDHDAIVENAKTKIKEAVKRFEELAADRDPLAMFGHSVAELPPFILRQRDELAEYLKETGGPAEDEEEGRDEDEGQADDEEEAEAQDAAKRGGPDGGQERA